MERYEPEESEIDRRHIYNLEWFIYLKSAATGCKDQNFVPLPLQVYAHFPYVAQTTHTLGKILIK
jgi:hypothetical protein